jgi:hypothetical protein
VTSCLIRILGIDDLGDGAWDIRFAWSSDGPDWNAALEAVKRDIPADRRSYDPETRQWSVNADAHTQMTLSTIFRNFWSALDSAQHPQESLFGAEAIG